jgi:hypothetical protein
LITTSPGAATSSTRHSDGMPRVVPQTPSSPPLILATPRWMPGRSTAGATRVSAAAESGSGRSSVSG